ncbi:serine/threonine-protein kinase [Oerskovia flava]|uniref:serine/threonine-protein kinase n=1 Tax=Oerskovia flava TaxID=2986422 RepID=UPI00223ED702|nr:serine/threonine-protein kinase [Oerskovia sp. JB1-3-2]
MGSPTQEADRDPSGEWGLEPGSERGGYRILELLGSGAMGTVYRAADGGGNLVAIKFLHAHLDADARSLGRERLRRESVALQRLHHPAVAQILDVELDGPDAFIVTELLEGPTLDDEIAERGPLDAHDLFELADQLAEALEAVHAAGVVHRDLKPSNVIVSDRGPVLIDFGIAHGLEDARVTSTGLVMGTPGYLAPELLEGAQPSTDTDWWGWSALLAYAATGRAPFGTRPVDVVLARARAGRADLAGLGPITVRALEGALRADPARRLGPTEVAAALRGAAEVGDVPGTVVPAAATELVPVVRGDVTPTTAVAAGTSGVGRGDGSDDARPTVRMPPVGAHDGRTAPAPVGMPAPDEELLDELGAPLEPGQEVTGYVRPAPARRALNLLSLGLPLVLLAGLYPGMALVVLTLVVFVARVVGVTSDSLHGRRERRGVARSDTWRTVLSMPWYLVRALVGTLPSVLVAGCAAVLLTVGGWWLLAPGRLILAPDPSVAARSIGGVNEDWVFSVVLCVAMLAAVLLAWFGPLTHLTRYGARTALAHVAPGTVGSFVVALVGLGAAVSLGVLLAVGPTIDWWPLPGAPTIR